MNRYSLLMIMSMLIISCATQIDRVNSIPTKNRSSDSESLHIDEFIKYFKSKGYSFDQAIVLDKNFPDKQAIYLESIISYTDKPEYYVENKVSYQTSRYNELILCFLNSYDNKELIGKVDNIISVSPYWYNDNKDKLQLIRSKRLLVVYNRCNIDQFNDYDLEANTIELKNDSMNKMLYKHTLKGITIEDKRNYNSYSKMAEFKINLLNTSKQIKFKLSIDDAKLITSGQTKSVIYIVYQFGSERIVEKELEYCQYITEDYKCLKTGKEKFNIKEIDIEPINSVIINENVFYESNI